MDQLTYLARRLVYENNLNYVTHIRQWCLDSYREINKKKRSDFWLGGMGYVLALMLAFAPEKGVVEWVMLSMWTSFSILFLWSGFQTKERITYWSNAVKEETKRVEEAQDKIALLDLEYNLTDQT